MHRFITLDAMRGIAAIAVMLFHYTQHTEHGILTNAALAVDLFFCLSGFVIAYSYTQRLQNTMSFKEYSLRRLIRLYPMFLAGLSLGILALFLKFYHGQTDMTAAQVFSAAGLNVLYLPFISDFSILIEKDRIPSALFPTNDPSWSLFFELLVNIFFGYVIVKAKKHHLIMIAMVGMAFLIAYVAITKNANPGWGAGNILGGFPRTIFGFFTGVCLFNFYMQYKDRIPRVNPFILLIFLIIIFIKGSGYLWLAGTLFIVPFLTMLGSVSMPLGHKTESVFDYLGWISYPLYCLHFPIYSIYTTLTHDSTYAVPAVFVCAPLSLIAAHFIAKIYEEPVRSKLAKKMLAATSQRVETNNIKP